MFFIRVTTSSWWWATNEPVGRGPVVGCPATGGGGGGGGGGASWESSLSRKVPFLLRDNFFCWSWIAACTAAEPFTGSLFVMVGLGGLEGTCFFGVAAPVPGVIPSFRGYWTFRVSRQSSVTQPSNLLLTGRGFVLVKWG